MATVVAAVSAVPLAFGTGPGHEVRQPLGIASIGGLLAAQVVTLYTTPVLFLLIDRLASLREAARPSPDD